MSILKNMNPAQSEAITFDDGPLLVLAGAGSGKTRVLTTRIAHLITEKKVKPYEILAVTFTNKAASEMRSRLSAMLGAAADNLWLGTFHSIGLRILKTEAQRHQNLGTFTIYDDDDQLRLIKQVMEELDINTKSTSPRAILSRISQAKNDYISAAEYQSYQGDYFASRVAEVYTIYQKRLREMGALDFGDLICETIRLFESNPEINEKYSKKFKHVLVDEYQDTNKAQYILMNKFAEAHRNICAVGDPDQSIYSWRGANIQNILEFESNWDDSTIIRLEQNYRSTSHILGAANSVIEKNEMRYKKDLWTENKEGEQVKCLEHQTEHDEAREVSKLIDNLVADGEYKYGDFAVFYRTNAQSRLFEEHLSSKSIPYSVIGGMRFYERMEVRDSIAYLRVLVNPRDSISLRRIVNVPPRACGAATIAKAGTIARENSLILYDAFKLGLETGEIKKPMLKKLFDLFDELRENIDKEALEVTALKLLTDSSYIEMWQSQSTDESLDRVENVHELLSALKDYSSGVFTGITGVEEESGKPSITGFLEHIALLGDIDSYTDAKNRATLMTLHSAKGLEFPVVFIVGLEEGLFPHSRSANDFDELEEERRLCYVGMTRAMKKLYLSSAARRTVYGETRYQMPSRFLDEIDPNFLDRPEGIKSKEPYYTFDEDDNSNYLDSDPGYDGVDPIYSDVGDETGGTLNGVPWRAGMRVTHPEFGQGIIKACSGKGESTKLTVRFNRGITKKIIAKFAKLTPLVS
ncbi:MAG: UvrD-helicase domain-containing protein [Deltaproteobacteria bacterium]|nr:UvrD-helicase domain-containing protein [Deltaproteobacteria bacterium]